MKYYCKEKNCNNEISEWNYKYGQGRCRSCCKKGKRNHQYIDGKRSAQEYDCIEPNCINKTTQKGKRCVSCGLKIISQKLKGRKRPDLSEINKKRTGKNNSNYIDGRQSKTYYCKECGTKICYMNWKYGSKLCNSCKQKGKLNNCYIDGKGQLPYTPDFTQKLKDSIRKRDNFECQGKDCNMTEEEHIVIYGRVLDIHHIDHNKKNCDKTNLISLCKQCNIRANFNRNYWQEYFTNKIRKIYAFIFSK